VASPDVNAIFLSGSIAGLFDAAVSKIIFDTRKQVIFAVELFLGALRIPAPVAAAAVPVARAARASGVGSASARSTATVAQPGSASGAGVALGISTHIIKVAGNAAGTGTARATGTTV
jgi:hypothetical protein